MPKNKPQRLNEVLDTYAPQGTNERLWFLVEHQMIQAKQSAQVVVVALKAIAERPENAREGLVAEDCLEICKSMFLDIQKHYSTFLSYLSDTDVSERISRKEL